MWTTKANGDCDLSLAGGYIVISCQYVYSEKPGYRVIAVGHKNQVFPNLYSDIAEARKDAEEYAFKIFERMHGEMNTMKAGQEKKG